jgi:hypothetical protein
MSRIRRRLLVVLIATLLIPAAPAAAGIGTPVIADCQAHLKLTRHYSIAQLNNALAILPADTKEYTNCAQVIESALTDPGGPGANNGAGSGSGGSFLPTPVLIVLVLLLLAAATFGGISLRRRREP